MATVYIGQIVHTKSLNDFEVFPSGFVAVDTVGKIIGIGSEYESWRASQNTKEMQIVHLSAQQFLMPGLVDCHIHAPQVAQIGLGLDLPLLEWLNTYTFPLESKFTDQKFALNVYRQVVASTIRCGTTLAAYFGTNHKDSTLILAKEALRQGQRALIGKVCSNSNSPDIYVETFEESVTETESFIEGMKQLQTTLVQPIITPRFAISCDRKLLSALGAIAKNHDLHIQTHISESVAEVDFVRELFSKNYAEVYDDAKLLTNKTVLAHGVHLEDEEVKLISARGTSVAHCPASNTMLSSGLCDVIRLLDNGIKVGLGTDVSGGNSISIQDAILRALDVSRHLEFVKKQHVSGFSKPVEATKVDYKPINYKKAIFLATLGGAQALALDHVTGNFEIGKEFDAILVDTEIDPCHNFDAYKTWDENKSVEMRLLELVQKFIYVGDDRNIVKVFIAGKQSLPGGIGFLVRLTQLLCSYNHLKELPDDLVNMRSLQKLDLMHNDLESLPSDMGSLRKLQCLYAQHNDIKELPEFDGCEELQELHVANNFIKKVPGELCSKLPHLKILDLRDNKIEKLPDEISLLQSLIRLDLSNNSINSLPHSLHTLAHLVSLQVEGNPIKSIRRDILQCGTGRILKTLRDRSQMDTISMLEVKDSALVGEENHVFPDKFKIRKTRSLIVTMQSVTKIPTKVFLDAQEESVSIVDFSKNRLENVPDGLEYLTECATELVLSHNLISSVPIFISQFSRLSRIDLSCNYLTDLPKEFGILSMLRELNIANNKFKTIPPCVYELQGLEILLARENQIEKIDASPTGLGALRRLATLDLRNNNIEQVPPILGNLKNITSLDIVGNRFRQPRHQVLEKGTDAIMSYLRDRIPV